MYARMVTSFVKPYQLENMTAIYREKLLPMLEIQPGFKGLYVFNDADMNKEISITLWDRLVDMEAFNVNLLALRDEIVPLLKKAPDVQIFDVAIPAADKPFPIGFNEMSLGVRIENPFTTD